jgi:hypothetical protein
MCFHFRLSTSKQSRVYLPEAPFPHAEVNILILDIRHLSNLLIFALCQIFIYIIARKSYLWWRQCQFCTRPTHWTGFLAHLDLTFMRLHFTCIIVCVCYLSTFQYYFSKMYLSKGNHPLLQCVTLLLLNNNFNFRFILEIQDGWLANYVL